MKHVLIAMAEPVLACGLQSVLESACFTADICGDAGRFYERFVTAPPEIGLLDYGVLPGMTFLADLRNASPRCRLLLCGRHVPATDREAILELGIDDILATSMDPDELLRAVLRTVSVPAPRLNAVAHRLGSCEPSEKRVLALIANGLNDREIGMLTQCPHRTVGAAVRKMIGRFGLRSRADLALYGLLVRNN